MKTIVVISQNQSATTESNSDTLPLTDISNNTSDECYLSTPNEVSSSSLAGWNPDQYGCNAPLYYPYSHLPSYSYPPCYSFNDTTGHTSNFAWPFAENFDLTTAVQRLGPLYPDCNSISRSPACSSSNSSASLPFFVKLLNSRIKVCASCRGPHMKGANCQLLPSPNNLCIGNWVRVYQGRQLLLSLEQSLHSEVAPQFLSFPDYLSK